MSLGDALRLNWRREREFDAPFASAEGDELSQTEDTMDILRTGAARAFANKARDEFRGMLYRNLFTVAPQKKSESLASKAVSPFLEPALPSLGERVERKLSSIPAFNRPSRTLGAIVETATKPFATPDYEALAEEIETGKKPEPLKLSPARLAGIAGEAFFPTLAEVAQVALPTGLGAGMFLLGGLKDVAKTAKAGKKLSEAEQLAAKLEKAGKAREKAEAATLAKRVRGLPISTETIRHAAPAGVGEPEPLRLGTFVSGEEWPGGQQTRIAREAAQGAKPVVELPPGGIAKKRAMQQEIAEAPKMLEYRPLAPEYASPARLSMLDKAIRPAANTIRDAGGLPGVPRNVAADMANAFENTIYERDVLLNQHRAAIREPVAIFKKLKPEEQRMIAVALDQRTGTGNPDLDAIASAFSAWRGAQRKAAIEAGIDVGETGWHRINPEISQIARLASTKPEEASRRLLKLFQESRPTAVPDDAELASMLNELRSLGGKIAPPEGRVTTFLPNLVLRRGLEIPGWMGDPYSPKWRPNEWLEALDLYGSQWSFGVADARNFGSGAEKFEDWLRQADNAEFQRYAREHREHFVGAPPKTVGAGISASVMRDIRALQTANKLGKAVISNAFQTLATTFPKSAGGGAGFRNALDTYTKAIQETLGPNREAAVEFARDIGALTDEYLLEIAALEGLGEGLKGVPKLAAEGVLKMTGFSGVENWNRTVSAAAGRVHLRKLSEIIGQGGDRALLAEQEIRNILRSDPVNAQALVDRAKSGLEVEARGPGGDRFAYEFAKKTQFRADPNDLPVWVATPLGRSLFQFKNFAYNYSRFLKDMFQRAGQGDRGPLMVFLAAGMPLTGEASRLGRRLAALDFEGAEEQIPFAKGGEKLLERYALDLAFSGGIGLAGDLLSSTGNIAGGSGYGIARGVGGIAGPTFGLPLNVAAKAGGEAAKVPGILATELLPDPFGAVRTGTRLLQDREPPDLRRAVPDFMRNVELPHSQQSGGLGDQLRRSWR